MVITVIGIFYGALLILAAFARNKSIDAMRIDALIIPEPSESTRPLNLVAGLLFAGYSIYSLLVR